MYTFSVIAALLCPMTADTSWIDRPAVIKLDAKKCRSAWKCTRSASAATATRFTATATRDDRSAWPSPPPLKIQSVGALPSIKRRRTGSRTCLLKGGLTPVWWTP